MAKGIDRARAKRGAGLKFSIATYATVSNFQPGTRIKYGPNPKREGSKSYARFEKYRKAQTVAEALKLGAKREDLCWELPRGNYKILGGCRSDEAEAARIGAAAVRNARLELSCLQGPGGLQVKLDAIRPGQEDKVAKELEREEEWRGRKLELAKTTARKLGVNLAGLEDIEAERKVADVVAEQKLVAVRSRAAKITQEDVTEVLGMWGFNQNITRQNVLPDGKRYVYSDTLGAIGRRDGSFGLTVPTKRYPNFARFLIRWLQDSMPELGCKFVCTSINVNANYAARRHRDANNEGPSIIRAFGDFQGGRLRYWPNDVKVPKRPDVDSLRPQDAVTLDIKARTEVFDGNRAHAVEPFSHGDRYSLVFFCAKGYRKLDDGELRFLERLGFQYPTAQAIRAMKHATAKVKSIDRAGTWARRKHGVIRSGLKGRRGGAWPV